MNDSSGGFLQDNAFNLCSSADGGGGFYVGTSNGAGPCVNSGTELTTSGWYTFNLNFAVNGGVIYPAYSILDSANTPVFSFVDNTNLHTVAATGGPRYGWLADENVLGLPISQVSLHINK